MATRPGTHSVLIVVDVQVGVVAAAWERDRIVGNVALSVRRARESGVPVVWVQHHDGELKPDTPEWQWVPELQPKDGEARVHKSFNSAFEDTDLLAILDGQGVSRIFLAGAATNWCVRATAYGALDRGFDVTLLSDAHTTENIELSPGRVVDAQSVVDDLNVAMRWLSYPGRTNAVATAAGADFARPNHCPVR
ncbi:MAG TPA: isochorismatase family protein [Casimicrobiaceae bacterium]|nr:isochorismatase family protein [Casimicrobiaceae bacterium]